MEKKTIVVDMEEMIKNMSDKDAEKWFTAVKNNIDVFNQMFPGVPFFNMIKNGQVAEAYMVFKQHRKK